LLPPRPRIPKLSATAEVEEVTLSEFDSRRYERHGGGGGSREAYHDDESDDDMPSGAQHVQCAQQWRNKIEINFSFVSQNFPI